MQIQLVFVGSQKDPIREALFLKRDKEASLRLCFTVQIGEHSVICSDTLSQPVNRMMHESFTKPLIQRASIIVICSNSPEETRLLQATVSILNDKAVCRDMKREDAANAISIISKLVENYISQTQEKIAGGPSIRFQ